MNADDGISLVWGVAALALVLSSLAARQLPIGKTVKMAVAWVAIFGGFFVLFLFKDEGRVVWQRAMAELSGSVEQMDGTTLRIRRHEDGHYWVDARVNGTPVRFMIDSGATTTTVSQEAAKAAGIQTLAGFPVLVQTANGTVQLQRGRIQTLAVGNIVQHDASILIGGDGLGATNLLGMSFLSSLKSWRVEGANLVLEP